MYRTLYKLGNDDAMNDLTIVTFYYRWNAPILPCLLISLDIYMFYKVFFLLLFVFVLVYIYIHDDSLYGLPYIARFNNLTLRARKLG